MGAQASFTVEALLYLHLASKALAPPMAAMQFVTGRVQVLLLFLLSALGLAQNENLIDPAMPLALDDECVAAAADHGNAGGPARCAMSALQVKARAQGEDFPTQGALSCWPEEVQQPVRAPPLRKVCNPRAE